MVSKAIAYSTLGLRILTLSLLIASAVCMVCNSYNLPGHKTNWNDLKTYRYVFATAVIGAVYAFIQIPFTAYYAYSGKRLIRHSCLPQFEFYGDKLVSYLLATGVGAGLAASMELKIITDSVVDLLSALGFDVDQFHSCVDKFLDHGIIATVLLALGFACMVVLSILSSLNRSSQGRGHFG